MKLQARMRSAEQEHDLAWKAADADLEDGLRRLFGRCPELSGFSVQAKVWADSPNQPNEEELFVTAIGIAPRLSKEQYAQIFEEIAAALKQLLSERPQAHSLLRGRTFTRLLH